MFNSKVNHMTVIVKGVRDNDYEGRELMMEVVRRNCKMDPRLVSQMVYSIRSIRMLDRYSKNLPQTWLKKSFSARSSGT
jgi:hypothetical protein